MNDFSRGIVFTLGMFMFGKSLYELGRQKERKINRQAWEHFKKEVDKMTEDLKKKQEEAAEEA